MTVLFTLIFLAAVVGIFKPYIGGMKRSYFGIAAAVAFVLVGVTAVSQSSTGAAGSSPAKAADTPSPQAPSGPVTPAAATAKWEYRQDKDEMRGTTSNFANVRSDNEVDLDFPYGTVHGIIWVRKQATDGLNVMFAVDKGQILCNSFSNSTVSIKFDDKPVKKFACDESNDGESNQVFLRNAAGALDGLRHSKKTVIEADFYQQGSQQFVFDTAGLNWK
jgi:hypothetical protein